MSLWNPVSASPFLYRVPSSPSQPAMCSQEQSNLLETHFLFGKQGVGQK